MGSVQSKVPPDSANAVDYLRSQELGEISSIFDSLSKLPHSNSNTTAIDKDTFGEYFPYPGILREQIFKVFDTNKDGLIDSREFIRGVAMCCKGKLDEKLSFCFSMFDLSGDGYVDKEELTECLASTIFASFALLNAVSLKLNSLGYYEKFSDSKGSANTLYLRSCSSMTMHPSNFAEEVSVMVAEAFENCDLNFDGKLSVDEFRSWMLCTPEIVRILYGVFEIRNHVNLDEVEEEFKDIGGMTSGGNLDDNLNLLEKRLQGLLNENTNLREELLDLEARKSKLLQILSSDDTTGYDSDSKEKMESFSSKFADLSVDNEDRKEECKVDLTPRIAPSKVSNRDHEKYKIIS